MFAGLPQQDNHKFSHDLLDNLITLSTWCSLQICLSYLTQIYLWPSFFCKCTV